MPGQSMLTKGQIADLGLIQTLDYKDLTRISRRLKATDQPPLSPSELSNLIKSALPPAKQAGASDAINTLAGVLIGIGGPLVRGVADLDGYLDAIGSDLEAEWAGEPSKIERWNRIRPLLTEMLGTASVRTTIKALDVSYEYANLLQSSRIMTDVRPIFNEEGSEIEGAVVSFTLRLNLLNAGQPQSLSIALDGFDLQFLGDQCQKAWRKAETALSLLSSKGLGVPLKIVGVEGDNDED